MMMMMNTKKENEYRTPRKYTEGGTTTNAKHISRRSTTKKWRTSIEQMVKQV
jgi:hypothetical protein